MKPGDLISKKHLPKQSIIFDDENMGLILDIDYVFFKVLFTNKEIDILCANYIYNCYEVIS